MSTCSKLLTLPLLQKAVFCFAGYGKPRDLADAATDALLTVTSQPGVLHQNVILAGIAAVRQVHSKQVGTAVHKTVNQQTNYPINWSFHRSISQSLNRSISHSFNSPLSQSAITLVSQLHVLELDRGQ